MKLYRGMSSPEFESRQGLRRKSDRAIAEHFTTDDGYTSDTQSNAGTGASLASAQLLHTYCSTKNKGAFLSFTESFDVAAWYSLSSRWRTGVKGIVIETNTTLLRDVGITLGPNQGAFPWEREATLILDKHVTLPDAAIENEHEVDLNTLRKCAASLSTLWPEISCPFFLEVFDLEI
ncbi:hypothetical protein U0039_01405 [Stenotrophomonas maltophilia]|uniref:hypothetical protein n=1 Tax=Stenotrophomonas TaxID=40323 RepID=UPI0011157613|nr:MULTISPECIES: hypothetical protein [Stenotrophomonas]QQA82864.1 hypothetical protein I6I01_23355 [Stenotrophomonas maltophilia]WQE24056.1 hypothetical protein U0039_01405 [Stenotrophomonas maltophilia]HDS1015846.1 hypothetical protein [Stenotrophomonas maltophilia]